MVRFDATHGTARGLCIEARHLVAVSVGWPPSLGGDGTRGGLYPNRCLFRSERSDFNAEISTRVRAQARSVFGNGLLVWRRDRSPSSVDSYVVVGLIYMALRTEVETCLFDLVPSRRWPWRLDARRLGSAPVTSQTLSGLRVVLSSASAALYWFTH